MQENIKQETYVLKHAEHPHEHAHSHSHKWEGVLYGIGLILFVLARFFPLAPWIAHLLDILTVFLAGNHVVIEGITDTYQQTVQRKKFYPNVHLLMAIAAFGAIIIGEYSEASLLILIFAGAHFLEDYAKNKSKKEITNLLEMSPTKARRLDSQGNVTEVEAQELKIGDRVRVLPGDQVPTDGIILEGIGVIDESSITGESIPLEKTQGDEVYGSTINGSSTFTMEITKESAQSIFGKILRVVEESQDSLSPVATKIKKVEPIYVTGVLLFVPLFILGSQLWTNWTWAESFYRGMVALVASSPCALAAASIPATLSAISNLAKRGILFKGGDYIANFASVKAVAFDKTGTLTKGKPKVTDSFFVESSRVSEWIAIIVAMEKESNHPLANAILEEFQDVETIELKVENHIGHGLSANYQGRTYSIGKRQKEDRLSKEMQEAFSAYSEEGKTAVLFKEEENVVGIIAMLDVPAEHSKQVIDYLQKQDISTYMITGDNDQTAKAVARSVGINHIYSNVLPENKAKYVQEIQEKEGLTAMLGDGVNDAPALVTSDIGFAMGEGTDVAIEVADAVIIENNLEKFIYAHRLAQKMNRIVYQNIAFSLLVVLVLNLSNIFGTMSLGISVIFHEGSTLIVILNGLRMLLSSKDKEIG